MGLSYIGENRLAKTSGPPQERRAGDARRSADGSSVQRQVGVERRVFAGVADADDELAGIDGPFVRGFIPVAEGARVE